MWLLHERSCAWGANELLLDLRLHHLFHEVMEETSLPRKGFSFSCLHHAEHPAQYSENIWGIFILQPLVSLGDCLSSWLRVFISLLNFHQSFLSNIITLTMQTLSSPLRGVYFHLVLFLYLHMPPSKQKTRTCLRNFISTISSTSHFIFQDSAVNFSPLTSLWKLYYLFSFSLFLLFLLKPDYS